MVALEMIYSGCTNELISEITIVAKIACTNDCSEAADKWRCHHNIKALITKY